MLFWPILGHFWCPVLTVVTFSSNLSENIPFFFFNPKKSERKNTKIQKTKKSLYKKNVKNGQKIQKYGKV